MDKSFDIDKSSDKLNLGMTSILWLNDEKIGIIMIINDITELASLKIRYSQQITNLLDSLVKALSTAIDERSRYTGKHTRNMVRMGVAFLDWLETTDSPLQFDNDRRRAFLMSIWLHDVGKLTIPLEIMDKATRLGDRLDQIEQRLTKMHLLDRIALLEGRIDDESFKKREAQRDEWMSTIHQINHAGYLKDEDFAYIQKMAEYHYEDEDGEDHPFLTEEEVLCLQIQRFYIIWRLMDAWILIFWHYSNRAKPGSVYKNTPRMNSNMPVTLFITVCTATNSLCIT